MRAAARLLWAGASLVLGAAPLPAAAHSGATGVQEFASHNAVAIVLVLVVLGASLLLIWLNTGSRRRPAAGGAEGDAGGGAADRGERPPRPDG